MRRMLLIITSALMALLAVAPAHATPPGGNGEIALTVRNGGQHFMNWVTGEPARPFAQGVSRRVRYAPGGAHLVYGEECVARAGSPCQGLSGNALNFAVVTDADAPVVGTYNANFGGPSTSGLARDGGSTHLPVDFAGGSSAGRIVWLRSDQSSLNLQLVSSLPDGTGRQVHFETPGVARDGVGRQWLYELVASPVDDKVYVRLGSAGDTGPRPNGVWEIDLSSPTAARRVLPITSTFRIADISPDGRHLLYTAATAGTTRTYAHDLIGGGTAELIHHNLPGTGLAGQPQFSPDGWHLAWATVVSAGSDAQRSATLRVASLNPDRTAITDPRVVGTLGPPLSSLDWIAWRPDGEATSPAPFTASPVSNDPGRIDFRSQVPTTPPATLHWDFGNGETALHVASKFVDYDTPGTYRVRHWYETSTQPPVTGSTTKEIEIPAPTLSVSLNWDSAIEDGGRLPLDRTFPATLRVRANTDGVGTVSGITFDEGVLAQLNRDDVLEIAGEEPPDGFDLAPGQARDFPVEITTIGRGPVTITSAVRGTDAAGEPVDGRLTRITRVGFDFEFAFETKVEGADGTFGPVPQEGIKLEYDAEDQRPVPRAITVDVTVQNTSGERAREVKLDMSALVRTMVGRDPTAPNAIDFTAYTVDGGERVELTAANRIEAIALGDLHAGAQQRVRLEGRAQDKGVVEVRGLARGLGEEREVSGHGSTHVRINQPLLLLVGGTTAAPASSKAGDRWAFAGFIKNTSPDETLDVLVLTDARGNVVGGPVDSVPESGNPLGLRLILEPGERRTLWRDFTSERDGATFAEVKLELSAQVDKREVSASEILVREYEGRPATERRVAIDVTQPLAQPVEWTWSQAGWIFTDSVARGFGRWVDGKWQEAQGYRERQHLALLHYWYLLAKVYEALDQDERLSVAEELVQHVKALTDESDDGVRARVSGAIERQLGDVIQAWETGDLPFFAAATGSMLGEAGPDALIEGAFARVAAGKLLKHYGKSALTKVDQAQQATLAARVAARGRKGFEPGDSVSLAHAFEHWGMDAALDGRLRAYARAKGIVITMRSRSAGSVQRLAEGLLGKIESIKAKNVNRIDIDHLGFDESHLDTAMYKRMRNWDFYAQRLPEGLGDEQVRAIKARWWQRAKEYYKEAAKLRKYEQAGAIPTPPKDYGMNLVDNGYAELKEVPWESRRFENARAGTGDLAATWDDEPAFQPRVWHQGDGHPAGFRAFTGDMDMISITDLAGRILLKERRTEVYRELAELGFEHPESLTWDNVAGRNEYVREFDIAQNGSDVLLAYRPDGRRTAVQLDTRKTVTDSSTLNFLLLHGLGVDFDAPEPTANPAAADDFPNAVTADDAGVPDPDDDTVYLAPPDADFAADPDAPLLRTNWDGSVSSYDPSTRAWTPSSGAVTQLPQSALTSALDAGETRLPIIEAPRLGASGAWFAAGQTVVINPGGATEERGTVAALGSIILAAPLRHSHSAGELVGVLPGSIGRPPAPTPPAGSADPPPVPTAPLVTPAAPFAALTDPTLGGRAVVGGTLRAQPGTFNRTPDAVSYQWLRNGKPIAGARRASYRPAKALVRARLSVRVTATHGSEQVHRTSPAVLVTWPVTVKVKVTGGRRLTVTVKSPGVKRAKGRVEVRAGGKSIRATVRRGTAKIALQRLRRGATKITVTYIGPTGFERVTTKPKTVRIR